MEMMPKNSERKVTRNKCKAPYLGLKKKITFNRPKHREREKLISLGAKKGVTVDEFKLRLRSLQQ